MGEGFCVGLMDLGDGGSKSGGRRWKSEAQRSDGQKIPFAFFGTQNQPPRNFTRGQSSKTQHGFPLANEAG